MPKKTHKLGELGDVDAVVKSSASLQEAAAKLGVNRITLYRWLKDGKIGRARQPRKGRSSPVVGKSVMPDWASTWAKGVIESYDLSPTELVTLQMADQSRAMALNAELTPNERARQQAEFSRRVKDLGLYAGRKAKALEATGAVRPSLPPVLTMVPKTPMVSTSSIDPRLALEA